MRAAAVDALNNHGLHTLNYPMPFTKEGCKAAPPLQATQKEVNAALLERARTKATSAAPAPPRKSKAKPSGAEVGDTGRDTSTSSSQVRPAREQMMPHTGVGAHVQGLEQQPQRHMMASKPCEVGGVGEGAAYGGAGAALGSEHGRERGSESSSTSDCAAAAMPPVCRLMPQVKRERDADVGEPLAKRVCSMECIVYAYTSIAFNHGHNAAQQYVQSMACTDRQALSAWLLEHGGKVMA